MMEEILLYGVETPMPPPLKPWSEEKGLTNFGENNCFINVVIQSLWHLEPFRLKFTQEKERHRHEEHCVYCALEVHCKPFHITIVRLYLLNMSFPTNLVYRQLLCAKLWL